MCVYVLDLCVVFVDKLTDCFILLVVVADIFDLPVLDVEISALLKCLGCV